MSKAFTREEDLGLVPEREHAPLLLPRTAMGQAVLREAIARAAKAGNVQDAAALEARLAAGIVAPPVDNSIAALGAEVTLRDGRGRRRVIRLVTADEVGLVERGASPTSPIGRAVAGAREGDTVELPGGGELTVARVVWPTG